MLSKSKIKYIQSLYRKKLRETEKIFVVQGVKSVLELVNAAPKQVIEVYGTPSFLAQHEGLFTQFGVSYVQVTDVELAQMSSLTTPNQALAIVGFFEEATIDYQKPHWAIGLNGLNDPGNLGTIIRLADWFGILHIIADKNTVDCYNPKTIQSSMGSIARVNIVYVDDLLTVVNQYASLYATLLQGQSIYELKQPNPGLVVIGNESHGIDINLLPKHTQAITIPKLGQAESLNAAVATGIVLGALVGGSG
jgi:RNA methyltransferase, TrmH family